MDEKRDDLKRPATDKEQSKGRGRKKYLTSPVCYAGSDEVRPEFQENDEALDQGEETVEKKKKKE